MRARTSGSSGGTPKILSGSLVLMVVTHFDVIERGNRVIDQHGSRAVQRNQVRRERLVADAHEPHGQSRRLLARKTRLEQSDHALLLFADAEQQDARLAAVGFWLRLTVDAQLVGGDQRNAAPRKK